MASMESSFQSGRQPPCQIEGVVTDAYTGVFASEIYLRALATGAGTDTKTVRAISDPTGRFLFSSLTPGKYKIEAQGVRYPPQTYQPFLNLTPAHCFENISFKLRPAGVITGRVMDSQGQPLARVQVLATTAMRPAGLGGYVRVGSAQTDSQGRFRISGLYEGQYYVAVAPPAAPNRSQAAVSSEMYVPEVYPGTRDPDAFTLIAISLGDSVAGVDFTLMPVKTVRLSGQIINAVTSEPVPHSRVALQSTNFVLRLVNMYSQPTRTDADAKGQFVIEEVPPGAYRLTSFSSVNRVPLYGELMVNPSPGEDLRDLHLVVNKLPEILGKVSLNAGRRARMNFLTIRLDPVASDPVFSVRLAGVRDDGTFVFPGIFPGQ